MNKSKWLGYLDTINDSRNNDTLVMWISYEYFFSHKICLDLHLILFNNDSLALYVG